MADQFAAPNEINQHVINGVKSIRVGIDKLTKDVEKLRNVANEGRAGRELSLSITKLEEAKMWLGKALGALGQRLPVEFRDEA